MIREKIRTDGVFLSLILVLLVACGLATPYPNIAMWLGFALAGYSVVANDSIQTLGTWLATNRKRSPWILWAYVSIVFVVVHWYGWYAHSGDVSYGRLQAKGFENAPEVFEYLQVASPVFLLILTRLKMPVSTTFLILSSFADKASTIGKVIYKSLLGYGISFGSSLVIWPILRPLLRKCKPNRGWMVAQWTTSALLWAVWLAQDAANVAVFLPRGLSVVQMIGFTAWMLLMLGVLMSIRGGRIQSVITKKTETSDVRQATVIDTVYALVLYVFKIRSKMPMSTTWVFLGNLAGREVGLCMAGQGKPWKKVRNVVTRDLAYAAIGLAVSLLVAVATNPAFRKAFLP